MNLTLDSEAMNAALHKSVLDALGQEGTARVVQSAIEHLLKPTKLESGYGSKEVPSPLIRAVQLAAEQQANTIVRAELEKPEYVEKIRGLVAEAFEQAILGEARDNIVAAMRDAMRKAITGRDY